LCFLSEQLKQGFLQQSRRLVLIFFMEASVAAENDIKRYKVEKPCVLVGKMREVINSKLKQIGMFTIAFSELPFTITI